MRSIKKTVTVTTVNVFKPDAKTLTLKPVGSFEVVGGLGERLAQSRAKREYGKDCVVIVNNTQRVYTMDADTFFKYAHEVVEPVNADDADDDDYGAYGDASDVD